MTIALLVVSSIAAVAAVAAVAVPLWQRRPHLDVRFTGGWSSGGDYIDLPIALENRGTVPLFRVRTETPDGGYMIAPLQPGEIQETTVRRRRPDEIDVEGNTPTVHAPVVVLVTYGRHVARLVHPVGPFSSDRATVER